MKGRRSGELPSPWTDKGLHVSSARKDMVLFYSYISVDATSKGGYIVAFQLQKQHRDLYCLLSVCDYAGSTLHGSREWNMYSFNRDFGQSTGLPIIASLVLVHNGSTAHDTAAVGLCWNPGPNNRVGSMPTMGLDICCAEAETKIFDCWRIFGETAEPGSKKNAPRGRSRKKH